MMFLSFLFGLIVGAIVVLAFLHRGKIKEWFSLLPALAIALLLIGCSEKQSFNTTELQRQVANENSLFNATVWRANSQTPDHAIIGRGDSTQTEDCPQGDGWASIDLMSTDRLQVLKLKCSTYSAGIGCVTAKDFKERPHLANQENRCNRDVPFPLPKIAK